jgi:colanic acid biosynthesis glycosyl transferase WcaI
VAAARAQRWLILTQYYPPEIGAPQIRLRSLVQELHRRGIDVEVLTGMPNYPAGKIHQGYEGRWRAREERDGVPIRRTWLYAATGKSARVRLANYFSFTGTALIDAMFGPKPAVMFVESQPLSLGLCAVLMKWLRGVPYIYNVPDLQIDVARELGFMQNRTFLRVALALENLFLKQAWRVSTVTDRFIAHFESRGVPRARITFLPNGADTTFLRPMPRSDALVARWGLEGKKVIAYVGTHAYYHGLDTLLDAATELRDRTDIAFLMIGDGPERERLVAQARERQLANVIFGRSPYEEMDQLYSIAYASVATLRDVPVAHGMRLSKIFPSLSCGVPVIYAGKGEAAELLAAKDCGVVVPPEQPRLLAEAISRLVDDPARRDALGERGRSFVEREYSWSAIVGRWLGELGPLPNTSGRAPIHVPPAPPVATELE